MTAYLITLAEPTSPVNVATVHRYADRDAAQAALGSGQMLIVGEEDITLRGASLVDLFNAVTESGLKKFESNALGIKRILAVLPVVAKEPLPMTDETTELTETVDLKEAKRLAKVAKDQEKTAAKQAKLDAKAAKASAKPARKPREIKLGAFAPVRASSALGEVLTKLIAGEPVTVDDGVLTLLKRARVTHGFDHAVAEDGSVTLVLPEGKTGADLIKVPAAPRPARESTGAPRQSMNVKADALAASGVTPEKPVIGSPTNQHRQKHFDKLAELSSAGKWDEVAAFNMKGIDSYSKDINRYRDRLLAAHATQEQRAAAE
jgi:hypothetical protein